MATVLDREGRSAEQADPGFVYQFGGLERMPGSLTGEAPSFSAGADLAGVKEDDFQDALHGVLKSFVDPGVVTVAYVNGHALGAGAQLMAACDVRVAAPQSVVGIPAAKLGLVVNHWTIEQIGRAHV